MERQLGRVPLLLATLLAIFVSAVLGVSQVTLQYATTSTGAFSRFGTLHIAAADDDIRSQVHVDVTANSMGILRQLSREENGRLYIAVGNDPREKPTVLTSISLCRLAQSGFAMNLTVTLDATETVVGLYAHAKAEWCSEAAGHSSTLEVDGDDSPLRVRVLTNYCDHGTQPDSDRFLAKIEREQFEKEQQKGDDRGFFAKYWMYIVPGVILYMVLTSSQAGEGGAGGGRGG